MESGFHKERMVYTQDELQIHEQENEYRSISINFKECRKWVADTQYEFAHGNVVYSENLHLSFGFLLVGIYKRFKYQREYI